MNYILYCDGFVKDEGGCSVAVTDNDDKVLFLQKYYMKNLKDNNLKKLINKYKLTVPVAEYFALFMALNVIKNNLYLKNAERVIIYSDADLIVHQINNRWEVSNYVLMKWYHICKAIMGKNTAVIWVSRKKNVEVLGH